MSNSIDFEGSYFTSFNVRCPAGCKSSPKPIYGKYMFKDDSAICKAGVHNGVIKDAVGGILTVSSEKGQAEY